MGNIDVQGQGGSRPVELASKNYVVIGQRTQTVELIRRREGGEEARAAYVIEERYWQKPEARSRGVFINRRRDGLPSRARQFLPISGQFSQGKFFNERGSEKIGSIPRPPD